jgi:hypothetical protein
MIVRRIAAGIMAIFLARVAPALASNYDELKSAALRRCESIDPTAYQSGLTFNPDGYRSFYLRSECFQKVAIEFRAESLCSQVTERRSLLSSSWGYSKANCQKLVAAGIAADRKVIEDKRSGYLKGAIRLRDFHIERNGNGRDFDIIPSFAGEYNNSYTLRFEIVGANSDKENVLLHSSGFYLDGNNNIRVYVPQEEIRKRFRQFSIGQSYLVRGSLILDVGSGSQNGKWSEQFIDGIFPLRERSQSVEREILF